MRIVAAILGVIMIFIVAQDGFETIVLPRRVSRRLRLARLFYMSTWQLWSLPARKMHAGNRREYYLSFYGPLSVLLLLAIWAIGFVIGFGLLQWGLGLVVSAPEKDVALGTYLYFSGTAFITLGLGDVIPLSGLGRFLTVVESGVGFAFLALIIGYVPIIYQAFSRREANISLLDARAGSPPTATEMLHRHYLTKNPDELMQFLRDWERWCAELLESHLSYPVLAYYRSQHERQSWLAALTAVLDVCALIMVGIEGVPKKPAKFTFALARHAAVDMLQVFGASPTTKDGNRLSPTDFAHLHSTLAEFGIVLSDGAAAEKRLAELRAMYEPFVDGLSKNLFIPLPQWTRPPGAVDDWQTSAWDHFLASTPYTLDRAIQRE